MKLCTACRTPLGKSIPHANPSGELTLLRGDLVIWIVGYRMFEAEEGSPCLSASSTSSASGEGKRGSCVVLVRREEEVASSGERKKKKKGEITPLLLGRQLHPVPVIVSQSTLLQPRVTRSRWLALLCHPR